MLVLFSTIGILYMLFLWKNRITNIIIGIKRMIKSPIKGMGTIILNGGLIGIDVAIFLVSSTMLGGSVFGMKIAIIINVITSLFLKKTITKDIKKIKEG